MVCNTIFSVCKGYKAKGKSRLDQPIVFRKGGAVHFNKRTYTLKDDILSLYTLGGRLKLSLKIGEF